MKTYLILDLDNTVWNKQRLDSRSYERVSQDVFQRSISMLTHPVTGEADTEFAKNSNHEIWRYKLAQILASGELLYVHTADSRQQVPSVDHVDIPALVGRLGPAALQEIRSTSNLSALVHPYLSPPFLADLARSASAIGVASTGAKVLQDYLLRQLGYYHPAAGINSELCAFSDEGSTKQALIERSVEKYHTLHGVLPPQVVYVGDSELDMTAVTALKQKFAGRVVFKGAGVLTGFSTGRELVTHGADVLLNSLADPQSLNTLVGLLQEDHGE